MSYLTAGLIATTYFRGIFGHGWVEVVFNTIILFFILVVVLTILYLIYSVVASILAYKFFAEQKKVYLELTPPALTNKMPLATEQLFGVLQGIGSSQSFKDRLLKRKSSLSLEVVSTKEEGIRYIAVMTENKVALFKQAVNAYVPDVRIKKVKDYLINLKSSSFRLMDYKLSNHSAYPLNRQDKLYHHDPIAYLASSMTKLGDDELMAFQLVISPGSSKSMRGVRNKILLHNEVNTRKRDLPLFFSIIALVFKAAIIILETILKIIGEIISPNDTHSAISKRPPAYPDKSPKVLSPAAQAVVDDVSAKLSQPLFVSSFRAVVFSDNEESSIQRAEGINSSLSVFSVPGYQSITTRRSFFKKLINYHFWQYKNRLNNLITSNSSLLSSAELAALYHFPHSSSARVENVVKSLSKTLPAPLALKKSPNFDVVLGENHHQGVITPIGLTAKERERHVYIIGGTGNGKTTMLEYGIVQDIRSGKGVAIIDPHGDSSQRLLKYIPKSRIKDVIYLNPRDLDYPIGINLLEMPLGLSGSELEHEKDLVVEAVISVLRKIFEDNSAGVAYRIERVLRNAIYTALTVEDATLFTILKLLTDKDYRRKVTKNLSDDSLKRFWNEELGKAGEFQRVKMSAGPITRIERFERSASAKRILGQAKSTINFDDIINGSKILICNFSKGRLGEDTSTLFGTTILAKLQLAAWRRDDIPENKRIPFYLYVDEFQNFASEHFMEMFTEARKYKLYLTIAQQSVFQLKDKNMFNTILDNVGTVFAFRSKSIETEKLLLHQFGPYVEPGEIGNLPSYNFYAKISAVEPQEPLSGNTILLDNNCSDKIAEQVIESSRKLYAKPYEEETDKPEPEFSDNDNDSAEDSGLAITKPSLKPTA